MTEKMEYNDLTTDVVEDETDSSQQAIIQAENNDSNIEEVGVNGTESRDDKGRFKPGFSGNPGGRPTSSETIISRFREDPKGLDVIKNVIAVAGTFGTQEQHPDAVAALKIVMDRLVPSLKSSEININTNDQSGFVFMPEQKPARREE